MSRDIELLELVNNANQPIKPVSRRNVFFGEPLRYLSQDPRLNTRITLIPLYGKGFTQSVDLYYLRLDVSAVLRNVSVASQNTFTQQTLLDAINQQTGEDLRLEDLVPFTIPTLGNGEQAEIELSARPQNLKYINTGKVTVIRGRQFLDVVIKKRDLDAKSHPYPTWGERRSARLVTWGLDFTFVKDAIKPTNNGSFSDWAKVVEACSLLGVPVWRNTGGVFDMPTTHVPDSNPAFERVVIQRAAQSSAMQGDVYLHYNTLATNPLG